jgi:hypothetical protein
MSQVITNRVRISRRSLLKGLTAAGSPILVGLPPLVSMFNSAGTAYAADGAQKAIESRFVLWFNGNGIPERYWILGGRRRLHMTPCLRRWRRPPRGSRARAQALRRKGMGTGHTNSMSGLMTGALPAADRVVRRSIGRWPQARDDCVPVASDRRRASRSARACSET